MTAVDIERLRSEYARGYSQVDYDSVKPILTFLRNNVSPVLTEKLDSLPTYEGIIREGIVNLRTSEKLSRPMACARYVRTNMLGPLLIAQENLERELRGHFLVWYLIGETQLNATYCIDRAEGVLRNGVREEILYASKGDIPPEVEKIEQRFLTYRDMLIKDPTGISLVEYQITRSAGDLLNFPAGQKPYYEISHPTYLLATMYTAALYKAIYPLSE